MCRHRPRSAAGLPAGRVVLTSHDGGETWSEAAVPDQLADAGTLTCTSATHCLMFAGIDTPLGRLHRGFTSDDAGATWTEQRSLQDTGVVSALVCPGPSTCFAVIPAVFGGTANVLFTADGGVSWHPVASGLAIGSSPSMWCDSAGACHLTVSETARQFVTTDGGTTWDAASSDNPPWATCNGTMCIAFTGNATRLSGDGGATWPTIGDLPNTVAIDSITCPAPTCCYAIGWWGLHNGTDIERADITMHDAPPPPPGQPPSPNPSTYSPMVPARLLETRAGLSTVDGAAQGIGVRGVGQVTELRSQGVPVCRVMRRRSC